MARGGGGVQDGRRPRGPRYIYRRASGTKEQLTGRIRLPGGPREHLAGRRDPLPAAPRAAPGRPPDGRRPEARCASPADAADLRTRMHISRLRQGPEPPGERACSSHPDLKSYRERCDLPGRTARACRSGVGPPWPIAEWISDRAPHRPMTPWPAGSAFHGPRTTGHRQAGGRACHATSRANALLSAFATDHVCSLHKFQFARWDGTDGVGLGSCLGRTAGVTARPRSRLHGSSSGGSHMVTCLFVQLPVCHRFHTVRGHRSSAGSVDTNITPKHPLPQ